MEQMRVVRLNARKFPPTEFETARLAHHGIQTEPFEPAHEEVSVDEGGSSTTPHSTFVYTGNSYG